jgi:2,4-dienoyl-CoA reductase-like NADH-dependent reductase (Old Yellow Enzyme family)
MHAGALSQGNPHRSGTKGPSALRPKGQQLAFYRGHGDYPIPEEMSEADIAVAVKGFASAAVRAREAGFDGVEVHGANGYLLDQFLTGGVNRRRDSYGGDAQARLGLIVEVAEAVRQAVGDDFRVGLRISQGKVNDFTHKWSGGESEAAAIFGTLGGLPVDYLHTTEFEAWAPAFGMGLSLAALAKRHTGKPVIANGSLHEPSRAIEIVARSDADIVALGRGALANPDWPHRLDQGGAIRAFDKAILSPLANLDNAASVGRTSFPLQQELRRKA